MWRKLCTVQAYSLIWDHFQQLWPEPRLSENSVWASVLSNVLLVMTTDDVCRSALSVDNFNCLSFNFVGLDLRVFTQWVFCFPGLPQKPGKGLEPQRPSKMMVHLACLIQMEDFKVPLVLPIICYEYKEKKSWKICPHNNSMKLFLKFSFTVGVLEKSLVVVWKW